MSFSAADNISRIHMLELTVMCTKITELLEALKEKNDSKIDTELYTSYKIVYDQIANDPTNDIYFEGTFEEHLEKTLTEFKIEINQRRKN